MKISILVQNILLTQSETILSSVKFQISLKIISKLSDGKKELQSDVNKSSIKCDHECCISHEYFQIKPKQERMQRLLVNVFDSPES